MNTDYLEYLGQKKRKVAVISDSNVAKLYGAEITQTIRDAGYVAQLFYFPAGEAFKTRDTKAELEDQLLLWGFSRNDIIIAVGGGVVTDMAGFIAATICRGVSYINIPTTLLAMVDASIGGKTAVNTPAGKNLIGAFWQPEATVIDPQVLSTLSRNDLQDGFVEIIKHAIILDADFFAWLNEHASQLLKFDMIKKAIQISCRIKQKIVEEDEYERSGKRRILNFGHTVGHALETITDYRLSHGQAVAMGMVAEARLATDLGKQPECDKIIDILCKYGLETEIPPGLDIKDAMTTDKKGKGGVPRFVLLERIGQCDPCNGEYCTEMTDDLHIYQAKNTPTTA